MEFTAPSRRALGLLSVGLVGVATTLLGAGGASAAPAPDEVAAASTVAYVVPAGTCAVRWQVAGGVGSVSGWDGGIAGAVETTTPVTAGQTYVLTTGALGGFGGADGEDSTVTGPGGFVITAKGGKGTSSARAANTVSGPPASSLEPAGFRNGPNPETWSPMNGTGAAIASPVACPDGPTVAYADAGQGRQAGVRFTPGDDDPAEPLDDTPTYQVSLDGGSWQTVSTAAEPGSADLRATVLGLTDGTTYSLRLRSVTAAGVSAPSAAVTVTPLVPIGVPGAPTVVAGPSFLVVSWTAVAAGTFPVSAYEVRLTGPGVSGELCRTSAAVLRCVVAARPGAEYSAVVVAEDAQGNVGPESGSASSGVVPAPVVPQSVPARDDGDLAGPVGPISSVTAGQVMTLRGSGFLPGLTVQLTAFSTPVSLGTVVTDGSGAFSTQVTLPAALASGTHHLVATGFTPEGTPRALVIAVTVSDGAVTRSALATTGFAAGTPLVGGGLALLVGAGLLVGARRRTS